MSKQKVSLDEFMSKRTDEIGKTNDGIQAVFKGFKAPASYDKEARTARFTMSTEEPDRDNDIVVQLGMDLTNFLKNPQGLLFHNSRSWPVGLWSDVEVKSSGRPKRTEGTFNFLPADGPIKEVDQAAWMVEHGALRAVSIGFMPKEIEYRDEEARWSGGYLFLESELYECSLVPIPANPSAMVKDVGSPSLAKEFIEEILDTYAKDPKTGVLIPRKQFEAEYVQIFGEKSTFLLMQKAAAESATVGDPETPPVIITEPEADPVLQAKETVPVVTDPEADPPRQASAYRKSFTSKLLNLLGVAIVDAIEDDTADKNAIVPGSLAKAKEDFANRFQPIA